MRTRVVIILVALSYALTLGMLGAMVYEISHQDPSTAICPVDGETVMEDDVKLSLVADHDHQRWVVTCTIDRDH